MHSSSVHLNYLKLSLVLTVLTTASYDTVDGRNPAPIDRWFIPLFIGLQP